MENRVSNAVEKKLLTRDLDARRPAIDPLAVITLAHYKDVALQRLNLTVDQVRTNLEVLAARVQNELQIDLRLKWLQSK